jgi:hypothetical protein
MNKLVSLNPQCIPNSTLYDIYGNLVEFSKTNQVLRDSVASPALPTA